MIIFQTLKYKNFLSTGNNPITIQLDKSPSTLIVGTNGTGKSTILDAISFALFNKPHRNVKRGGLVNSVNGKGCEVTIEFDTAGHSWKVLRGIKPNKFEVYQNDKMIDQQTNVRDYQKFLEQNILKLNHKSFHQVVVLGSSSFIPFMQLPAWSRRAVIEDLLDINIFSKMNALLKERNSKIKDELTDINHNIDILNTRMESQSKYIKSLESLNKEQIEGKRESIEAYKQSIDETFKESQGLGKNLTTLIGQEEKNHKTFMERMTEVRSAEKGLNDSIKSLVKEARFYEDNDNCPTCDQEIDATIKSDKLSSIKTSAADVQQTLLNLSREVTTTEKEGQQISNNLNQLRQRQQKINSNNEKISLLQQEIDKVQKDINQLTSQTGDTSKAKTELSGYRQSKQAITEKKLEYVEERTYNEVIGEMLKDTGIKTKVIKQYLPVMNRLINNYLQILDFFVAFHLDESFNETIRSRHRDSFNYASFSEGEKQRIDLALLFTWRQVAKMKNSAATNLLILDETFDSSLDNDGIDNLTKILQTLENGTNVFIISHKGDILENKFRSKIEFFKSKNFSKIA